MGEFIFQRCRDSSLRHRRVIALSITSLPRALRETRRRNAAGDEILFASLSARYCRPFDPCRTRFESSVIQLTSGRIRRGEIESFGLALASLPRIGTRNPPRGGRGARLSELCNQITGYR